MFNEMEILANLGNVYSKYFIKNMQLNQRFHCQDPFEVWLFTTEQQGD